MSVAGIFSSSLSAYDTQSGQGPSRKFWPEFQQLGQDLNSGNLTAAQADLVTLEQNAPQNLSDASTQSTSTASPESESPLAQAFSQLAQDLQSGNLTAAQQDFATIKQDFADQSAQQSQASQGTEGRHHHLGAGGSSDSEISQLFSRLDQELQSGDLTSAQQSYNMLEQDFQALTQHTGGCGQSSTANTSLSA